MPSAPAVAALPGVANEVTRLTHELANLLDGSSRCLGLAQRALTSVAARDLGERESRELNEAMTHLRTVSGAMDRMSGLVRRAMRGGNWLVDSPQTTDQASPCLGDAITHAVRVLSPQARGARVLISTHVSPSVADAPAETIYPVILNGVKNAIESIERRGGGGKIDLAALPGQDENDIVLEIVDDGVGIPKPGEARRHRHARDDRPVRGVGLAVCAEVVRQIGGSMTLEARSDGVSGAALRVAFRRRSTSPISGLWLGGPRNDRRSDDGPAAGSSAA
ncbi:MAG: ATP-binding protein [Planctomycetota bacterium]|nr:ATP-binding protein [Planctomycetota bacterium]